MLPHSSTGPSSIVNSSGSARLGQGSGRDPTSSLDSLSGFLCRVAHRLGLWFRYRAYQMEPVCYSLYTFLSLFVPAPVWRVPSSITSSASLARCTCLLASAPSGNRISRHLLCWVVAVLLVGFRRVPALSQHGVDNHSWSLGDRREMPVSPLACCPYAVCQMRSLVPCAVTVHGAPGHNRWGVAETPLPAKSQGRNMDCLFKKIKVSVRCRVLFKRPAHRVLMLC